MLLLVTGLPSTGKTRLVDALSRRLGGGGIIVGSLPGAHVGTVLHVHAESDAEALIEGAWRGRDDREAAQVVVRVDWERVDASVERVLQALHARTVAVGALT